MSGPALLPAAGDATEATGRRRRTVILIAVLWLRLLLMVAFAFLVTMLLFARSDMYADRGERPGFTRIISTLLTPGKLATVSWAKVL